MYIAISPPLKARVPSGFGMTIALHLMPGIAFGAAFVGFSLAFKQWNTPPALGAYAAGALVLVPLQWWILRRAARRHGRQTAFGYRNRLPLRQYAVYGGLALAWAVFTFAAIHPLLAPTLHNSWFDGVPDWLDIGRRIEGAGELGRAGLVISWSLGLLVGGLLVPVMEELYFRGYLLPRMEPLGIWAPILNTLLFAIYHVAQPWLIPTRFVATLPLYFLVWRTRSVYLAIGVHVALNIVGDSLLTLPELWQ